MISLPTVMSFFSETPGLGKLNAYTVNSGLPAAACHSFPRDRAKYLLSKGSLFFKHIIDEGHVILGSADDFFSTCASMEASKQLRCRSRVDF